MLAQQALTRDLDIQTIQSFEQAFFRDFHVLKRSFQEHKGKTAQCLELLEGIEGLETANELVKNSLQTTFEEVQRETKALVEKHQ